MTTDTERLIEAARRGDAGSFALLIGRFEGMALAVAFGVLADADAAGEVVQEAFVRSWERLRDLRDPASFGAWLCGIVRRLAIDTLRRRVNRNVEDLPNPPLAPSETDPAEALPRREIHALLDAALAKLDEESRTIVALRYYENLSSKQIAVLMSLSPAAVDMRLSRARRTLRETLTPAAEPAGF